MNAEFEERQFESYLNAELAVSQELIYVPGLVLERHLGIDAAIWSNHPMFWRVFGRWGLPFGPPGRLLREVWDHMERCPHLFPALRCNIFLQHKRPEFLERRNSLQWPLWARPYYRFRITPHQQQTLEALERRVSSAGVVAYSCPAFHRLEDLWQHIRQGHLVDNTNFSQPRRITGHNVYTFTDPGRRGRPNPNGDEVESDDIREMITRLREHSDTNDDAKAFFLSTAKVIDGVMEEAPPLGPFQEIVAWQTEGSNSAVALAVAKVHTFCYLNSTTWLIAVAER